MFHCLKSRSSLGSLGGKALNVARTLVLLLSGSLLSGCVAAAVPLAVGAAIGDTGPTRVDLTPNPALRMVPDLGDPQLTSWQNRLRAARAAFPSEGLRLPESYGESRCDLDEDAAWRIASGMTRNAFSEKLAGYVAASSFGGSDALPQLDVRLLEGQCADNKPVGPFVAAVLERYDTSTMIRHITGNFEAGLPSGEWITHSGLTARAPMVSTLQTFTRGEPGRHTLLISGSENASAGGSSYMTMVQSAEGPGIYRRRAWAGSILSTDALENVFDVPHGWTISYPVQYNQRRDSTQPPTITYACFQNGRPAADAACGPKPEAQSQETAQ